MPDSPSNAKKYALRGLGGVLTTVGAGLAAHVTEIGQLLQKHPSLAIGLAAGGGAILYAWALWTYSLWRAASKFGRIEAARKAGRPICGCTETGEIMLVTPEGTSFWQNYECPKCDLTQQVKVRD